MGCVSRLRQVSTHSRPKAAASGEKAGAPLWPVSTHSRPKAAAFYHFKSHGRAICFNTQPPEGGCSGGGILLRRGREFQHTAARRRLLARLLTHLGRNQVSTHSRPKAAAHHFPKLSAIYEVSTHSRPKAAAFQLQAIFCRTFCFNTQPPEGGCLYFLHAKTNTQYSFNTQPPEGGC